MDNELKKNRRIRLFFQCVWFALTNGYAYGFIEGKIYRGKAKGICVPGLNCYSCPGALMSCPIGSLQALIGGQKGRFPFYVLGFLMLFGSIFGRFVCGWLCPFGLVQDILYRIPVFKKIKNLKGHRYLIRLKYFVLLSFVILLPFIIRDAAGNGSPWFCEYICPSGTLFGGMTLIILNPALRAAVGFRFAWKALVLAVILILSIKVYRPFCKYLCPLGAAYSVFNPIAIYRMRLNELKCISCGACSNVCKMGVDPCKAPNSTECIRCGECTKVCPSGALKLSVMNKTKEADND